MERGGIFTWWHYFRQGEQTGQVATLITLTIAVIFLFVAVTMNIGRISQKKTVTANAADGAAMKLASYIGSYANKLSIEFLDGKDKTDWKRNWGGFWVLLAVVVLSVIAVLTAGMAAPWAAAVAELAAIGSLVSSAVFAYKVEILPGKVAHRIQRELNKLKLEDNLTEQAILYALANTVDDPVKKDDEHDYDEDGSTTDKIPRFASWYAQRVDALVDEAGAGASRGAKIADFLPNIETFAEECEQMRVEFTEDATRPLIIDDPEQDPDAEVPAGKDGELVALLKELLDLDITVSFWKPGADTEENADDLDDLSTDLNLFYVWALGEKGGLLNCTFEEIVQMFDIWMAQLYNPEDPEDTWYETWNEQIAHIDNWRPQLYGIISQLDELIAAQPEEEAPEEGQPEEPAQPEEPEGPSREELLSLRERVVAAIRRLDDFQEKMSDFNTVVVMFYNQTREDFYAHPREATYSWDDSLGLHHVRVHVSEFAMPRIKVELRKKKHRLYYMIRLVLLNPTGNVTVTVTRYDQSSDNSFFARGNIPLWKFRYTRDAQAEERINPKIPEQALALGMTSVGTAQYTYNARPRIVGVK